ncbi:uncharacterized protein L969DRAFT_58376 [Mixia osmundae IAM 14324]|uniref:RlpA-like protein double-psi beta-barrel domain-containing protein n=1 Tax=Mixia osmundae (strain CBS 9802 / IAM 14324 / JCM 22182 / KY 12970) TaxID=764103 RepID=G7DY12_MIXOS|nr:uncharacterized protein L969DRAFT_58376 [Mixia osmundae IAM 14324]KEI41373.1 hypothetical protein L969DRAFT_58376 [Mixia osmundae IAM 14324]GAA95472.1 hypothetical protein E5Q_02126 [Mixia osmundae IAM 14324]
MLRRPSSAFAAARGMASMRQRRCSIFSLACANTVIGSYAYHSSDSRASMSTRQTVTFANEHDERRPRTCPPLMFKIPFRCLGLLAPVSHLYPHHTFSRNHNHYKLANASKEQTLNMFAKTIIAATLAALAVAAPLEKRGGYWSGDRWVDDCKGGLVGEGYYKADGSWYACPNSSPWSATSTGDSPKPTTYGASTSGSANSGSYSGSGTYYYQGGNAGACGAVNSDSAYIVAMNSAQFSGSCGKQVTIYSGGKSVTATVADECPTCGYGSIDLSTGVFSALADMSAGLIGITWSYT